MREEHSFPACLLLHRPQLTMCAHVLHALVVESSQQRRQQRPVGRLQQVGPGQQLAHNVQHQRAHPAQARVGGAKRRLGTTSHAVETGKAACMLPKRQDWQPARAQVLDAGPHRGAAAEGDSASSAAGLSRDSRLAPMTSLSAGCRRRGETAAHCLAKAWGQQVFGRCTEHTRSTLPGVPSLQTCVAEVLSRLQKLSWSSFSVASSASSWSSRLQAAGKEGVDRVVGGWDSAEGWACAEVELLAHGKSQQARQHTHAEGTGHAQGSK